jgi:hypothetical protein
MTENIMEEEYRSAANPASSMMVGGSDGPVDEVCPYRRMRDVAATRTQPIAAAESRPYTSMSGILVDA